MEQPILKQGSKRRSKQSILQLLEDFAKAGMSVQSFCKWQGIGKSTFHKWQSRYKSGQLEQTTSKAFAAIEVIAAAEHRAAIFAEVRGIKIYQPVSAAYLKTLLS